MRLLRADSLHQVLLECAQRDSVAGLELLTKQRNSPAFALSTVKVRACVCCTVPTLAMRLIAQIPCHLSKSTVESVLGSLSASNAISCPRAHLRFHPDDKVSAADVEVWEMQPRSTFKNWFARLC